MHARDPVLQATAELLLQAISLCEKQQAQLHAAGCTRLDGQFAAFAAALEKFTKNTDER